MTEKVKLTKEQADAIDTMARATKGMLVVDLLRAIQEGYEVEPEYKVGDWVFNLKAKRLAQIDHRGITGDCAWVADEEFNFFHTGDTRLATPEEIKAEKERRLWAKIGREVGEFRIGDIRILDDGNSVRITDVDYARAKYIQGSLKGFFPVESFISFEEVESNA